VESVIQIDHGQALAQKALGDNDTAAALFKECRSRSARIGFWSEYVRACEAIANLSWSRGRKKTAVKQYESALAACQEHHVFDAMPRIALNCSRLLRLFGQAKKSRRLLAKHIDAVVDHLQLSDFHSTLAGLCEEAQRSGDARKHWRIAIESAEAVGNDDDIAYCGSQFAEFERTQNKPDLSVRQLEKLLDGRLSAEDRATALKQLFDVLLEANSEARAVEVFEVAQKHMRKYGFRAHLIDIHMSVFDHNWNGNRESRLNSLQAFVGAFVAAVEDPESEYYLGAILEHVMRKLAERSTAPPLGQLEWIHVWFEEWLTDQLNYCPELISALIMPLRYAKRLIPFNADPLRMLDEIERFYRDLDT